MAKSKKLCKKPLLILSLCLVAVFAAALIIMAVVPYAVTPYTGVDGLELKHEYVFSKDVYKEYINDSEDPVTTAYKIEDGEVKSANVGFPIGEINAYTFTVGDTVYTNTFTKVLKIVSIVGVSLGGVGLVLYFVLNNKNGKTKKSSKKK